jgi:hypothetical protein
MQGIPIGETLEFMAALNTEYAVNDLNLFDNHWDDFDRRVHLQNQCKSKRYMPTKWYSVIYK